MNLKQIQAVEFIISRMNHNKRLVVEYKDQLLSADFLTYSKPYPDTNTIYALTNENNNLAVLEDESSSSFFANSTLYTNTTPDNFGNKRALLNNQKYVLGTNKNISFQTLKDTVQHVLEYDKDPNSSEKIMANVTPRHVQFLNTNTELPFYLFPKEADFTVVSLIDRELTFD